jgi:hypothetical protein
MHVLDRQQREQTLQRLSFGLVHARFLFVGRQASSGPIAKTVKRRARDVRLRRSTAADSSNASLALMQHARRAKPLPPVTPGPNHTGNLWRRQRT